MTTPADLHTALLARLRTAPAITVYEGTVPPSPPAGADGRVYPYAVIWPGGGGALGETSLDARAHGTDWRAQVTVVAGDLTWCLQAIALVRAAAVGVYLATDTTPVVDDTPPSMTLLRDPDVTPTRWYLPVLLRCTAA